MFSILKQKNLKTKETTYIFLENVRCLKLLLKQHEVSDFSKKKILLTVIYVIKSNRNKSQVLMHEM
jgi:hypothetical protein